MTAIIPLLLLFVLFAPPDGGEPSGRANHPLKKLHAGCWTALGVNTLHDVRYVPEPGGKMIKTIMTAWSGAAYNTDRDQLWVHGGGHGDGADNSVYSFDVETLTWTRLFDTSPARRTPVPSTPLQVFLSCSTWDTGPMAASGSGISREGTRRGRSRERLLS